MRELKKRKTHKKEDLKEKIPAIFSPIYVSDDILETGKTAAVYKFTTIFFPSIGPPILKLLLDMENHSQSIIAKISPQERESLIKELEGVSIELKYAVKDGGKELMNLPVMIFPSEVLKNAVITKEGSRYNEKMQEEINNIIISFIKREVEGKVKTKVEDFLKNMFSKPKIPPLLNELLNLGFINREGRLAEGTTIIDLISGKYAGLFKEVAEEELLNESLLIKETLETYCHLKEEEGNVPINEILREKGILEITFGEI